MKKIFFTVLMLIGVLNVNAQFQETIDSGRPGNSIGVFTVGKNVFQLETGLDYNTKNETAISNSFFRYGLFENFELNAGLIYGLSDVNQGTQLYSFGAKLNIFEGDSMLPSSAFQFSVSVPEGANQNSFGSALFIFGYPIADKLYTTVNFGANIDFGKRDFTELNSNGQPTTSRVDYVEGFYTLNFLYNLTDKINVFVEPYGAFNKRFTPTFVINVNAGMSYLVTKDLQLDLLGSKGLKGNTDFTLSAGLSWRLVPKSKNKK